MKRRTFDGIVTLVGLGLSIFLFIAAGLLQWGYNFANDSVKSQLVQQKISFPAVDNAGLTSLPKADQKIIAQYAGMPLTTGKQAQAYADHYIAVHLNFIGGGKTYSEVSGEAMAASAQAKANPSDTALAAKVAKLMETRQTLFMGETLRGLLLNAYAFWQLGQIAKLSSLAAYVGGGILLILTLMGFMHLRRTPESSTI